MNPSWKLYFAVLASFFAWWFYLYFTPTSIIQTINGIAGLTLPPPYGNLLPAVIYSVPPAVGGVYITYLVAGWTVETEA